MAALPSFGYDGRHGDHPGSQEAAGQRNCNIEDYGAAAGGSASDNRAAVQEAIDTCAEQGGGTVYVPTGTFRAGTIYLKSHVTLFLEAGAVLRGSSDPADYDVREPVDHVPEDAWGSVFIIAEEQQDVTLTGHGTIRGGELANVKGGENRESFRPRMLAMEKSEHVRIEGITLRDSDRWTLHLYQCESVFVRDVGIYANAGVYNTDGIAIDGSTNVAVVGCDIAVGDDAIVLKTTDYLGPPRACENVTVTGCTLSTRSTCFKVGTETHADLENIVFSNSVIYGEGDSRPHDGIALETMDGGNLRGVTISNVVMRGAEAPLFVRIGNRGRRRPDPVPGTLQDVTISNVVAFGATVTSPIAGLPGHPVENVSISGLRLAMQGGGTAEEAERTIGEKPAAYPRASMFAPLPACGLFARHVQGLSIQNVNASLNEPDARPFVVADDVTEFHLDVPWAPSNVQADYLIDLKNVRRASIRGLAPPPDISTWVRVAGKQSRRIVLMPSSLAGIETPLSRADDVPPEAVQLKA